MSILKARSSGVIDAAFRGANKWVIAFAAYALSLSPLIAKRTKVKNGLQDILPEAWKVYWFPIAITPLGVALSFQLLVWLRRRSKENKLATRGINYKESQRADDPIEYFSISPLSAKDVDRYKRADRAHLTILQWLRVTKETIVYLTSVSGAGKTSLLQAFVLPKLETGAPAFKYITVRSFHDPAQALKKELLAPGAIWKLPPKTEHIRAVLEQACTRLSPTLLLLVFDQFEEFLIIHERDRQRMLEFVELLASVQRDPIPNLKILFVLRSDYAALLQPLNDSRMLPSMHFGTNAISISAFREVDARKFLEESPLEIQPGLMDEIFHQIREIEPDEGLSRPITLNMMGLFLERKAINERRPIESLRNNFLEEYLYQCIRREDVREHARPILREMITFRGTNRVKTVPELSRETGLSDNAIMGCLVNLKDQGIVRCVDEDERAWETSHDLVAQLLNGIFRSRWHVSTPLLFLLAPILPLLAALLFAFKISNAHTTIESPDTDDKTASPFLLERTLLGKEKLAEMTHGRTLGIDVTHHDEPVDWRLAKQSGVVFAFAKATEGIALKDSAFMRNWEGMRQAKVIRGAFHELLRDDPKKQADLFFSVVGPLADEDLPPAICFEGARNGAYPTSEDLRVCLENVERLYHRRPIIYGGFALKDALANNQMDNSFIAQYPLWYASYSKDKEPVVTPGWATWTFWQFTDGFTRGVPGLPAVDTNLFNGSEIELQQFITGSKR